MGPAGMKNPVKVRKLPGKRKYRVTHGGKVSAVATTKKKAEAQKRLLQAVKHGMKPRKNAATGWKSVPWILYDFSLYKKPRVSRYAFEANNSRAMLYKWKHLEKHDDLTADEAMTIMKLLRNQGFTVSFFDYSRKVQNNPPMTKIYNRVVEIKASKAGMPHACDSACRRAGHNYKHRFSSKACIYGLPDGSILIR